MRHTIEPDKYGPRTEAMTHAIESCVHCGFCLAACPTYEVLSEEMDSPRGRIYLMKNVLEENLTAQEAQPYIDRCLGCMACVPACPSGVAYGDLLVSYRAQMQEQRQQSMMDSFAHRMICETLPYPQRFRMAARTGKLAKLMQSALPEKLVTMIGLIPDKLPKAAPLPEVVPAKGIRRARVALVIGCVQQVLAPQINEAALRVLAENGVETIIPKGQGCCGSIMLHVGEDHRAQALARNNLNVFPDLNDMDAIITTAAGCGSGMHDYPLLFAETPEASAAQNFADKVQDVSQFLAELGITAPPALAKPLVAVYQDACHLLHAQGIHSAPRQLLGQVGNLTLVPIESAGLCCGSAGTYNLEQPEIAHELGQRKAATIIRTGANLVASGNIGCLTQIRTHLALQQSNIPALHTLELLDMAYRGLDPQESIEPT